MPIKSINLAVLFVEDLARARSFYEDALGLTVKSEDAQSLFFELAGASLILLNSTGARELLSEEEVSNGQDGAHGQLVSLVDDLDALCDELRAKGVEFIRGPEDRPWGMRTAHLNDPDGHVWEISQPIARME